MPSPDLTPSPDRAAAGAVEPGIYIASKAVHGPRWREWREWREAGHPIISTWIDEAEAGRTTDWADLWGRCISEASRATVTIIYREDGEELKGARVEVGAALSHGRHVIVVGDVQDSWTRHPNVTRVESFSVAMAYAALKIRDATTSRPVGGEVSDLAEVERLRADFADVSAYAHKLQAALTGLALGGSENFVRHGDGFRADIPACVEKVDRRFRGLFDRLKTEIRARKTAEAHVATFTADRDRLAREVERLRPVAEAAREWTVDRSVSGLVEKALFVAVFDAFPGDFPGREACPCGESDTCDECIPLSVIRDRMEKWRAEAAQIAATAPPSDAAPAPAASTDGGVDHGR